MLKATALNTLYYTNIHAIGPVAKNIHRNNIDEKLTSGVPELVNEIAPVEIKGKIRRNYSFASKYCSWHNPEAYPIYDRFVADLLWQYQVQNQFSDFKRGSLLSYPTFKNVIEAFRTHYGLTDFSFKQLDIFLWSYGKELTQG